VNRLYYEPYDLAYKPNLLQTVERHRQLWTGKMREGILARIDPEELPFVDFLAAIPDVPATAQAWDHNFRIRTEVHDDLLPVAKVSFGSAAFGGFLGAEVLFKGGAGWARPLLKDYSQLGQLRWDPDNPWIQRQLEACHYFLTAAQGKFALTETETIDTLNFVENVRGSAAFTDLYEHSDELKRLMDFACDFNIRLIETQREILAPASRYQEGMFFPHQIWLPGQPVWLSVDAYGLCSPKTFEELGRPWLQRIVDHFGSGWLHVHAAGMYLLPVLVNLKKLWAIQVGEDPGFPRPFEALADIRASTGDLPLMIDCTGEELERGITDRTLPGGTMYCVLEGVATVKETNRLMEKVRAYQAPS